ncbi:hypothetical protein KC963_05600 [Candidatus Saccharibacteria bacterium]|nr:hypothetical protein [Candidatus Saccharibacteria bacterium]
MERAGAERMSGEVLEQTILQVEDAIRRVQHDARGDLFDEHDLGEFTIAHHETGVITAAQRVCSSGDRYRVEVSKEGGKPTTIEVLSPRDNPYFYLTIFKGDREWRLGSNEKPPKFVKKTLGRLGVDCL